MGTHISLVKGAIIAVALLIAVLPLSTAIPAPTDHDGAGKTIGVARFSKDGLDYLKKAIEQGKRRIAFEVAENGLKFAFDQGQPLDENGFPLYGNNFITQGYIYPPGTLKEDPETGLYNGVNPDGSPEFPEQVLGTWICRGWVFGDEGYNIPTGPVVATTQIYDFHKVSGQFGKITVVTDGTELIDVNVPILRAITGGTGPYSRARGQLEQTLLGLNPTVGVSLKYQVKLK